MWSGKCKFYPGVIAWDRGDGTKDIDYDDDEKDSHDRGADRRRPERWAQQRIRNYAVNNENDGGRAPMEHR